MSSARDLWRSPAWNFQAKTDAAYDLLHNVVQTGNIITEGDIDLRDGGTVTQVTSITTGVTLNTHSGQITTVTAPSIAAGAEATFTVTNNRVSSTDTVIVNVATQFTDGFVIAFVSAVANGSFDITLSNLAGVGVTAGTAVINFAVIGGSSS